ncbi:ABC transporter ATP-binding protein [Demequina sp.]|uniref:ABC transporter ATP-binding protein n=1 Tax=Demequina sp. TaxID=2050685 RepID=UPI0025C0B036|nr:ABC transporter ATP-binding protein [Demequina sp.]
MSNARQDAAGPDGAITEINPQRPLKSLLRLYRGERTNLGIATVAFAVKHSPVWITPFMTAIIIDAVVTHDTLFNLLWPAGVMVLAIGQNYPASLVYVKRQSVAVRNVEAALRRSLTRRLQELSIGFHRRTSAGVLQAKVIRDVETTVEASRQSLDTGLGAATTLVGAVVLTAVRVPEFLPVYALAVPAAAALLALSRKRMQQRNADFRSHMEHMSVRVAEMAHLIPITRAHASEDIQTARVDDAVVGVRSAGMRLDMVNGRFGALSWVGFQSLTIGCLIGAAWLSWSGMWGVTAGDVVMLSSYFVQLTGSVTALLLIAPILARGIESVRSIGEVLVADDIERNAGKPVVQSITGQIDLEGLRIEYPDADDEVALDHVSLSIAPGQTVAFVGPSGSGKSTLLNAVIGFVTPASGRVLVDHHDLQSVDMRSIRKHVAVVPQEALLFEGSVRDNVTYGSSALTDSDVVDALKGAQAWEFVSSIGGLDATIGERGARLSGGQRQRITIARALVRDPKILLLDEATSALDSESERLVQLALQRLMEGRTTLVVAHRLSTIRAAHRIVVLDKGRILETGTHTELLDANGWYAAMHRA